MLSPLPTYHLPYTPTIHYLSLFIHPTVHKMVVRWNDSTHGAHLRGLVASGEVRLDQLDPNTLWNLAVTHFGETVPPGQ